MLGGGKGPGYEHPPLTVWTGTLGDGFWHHMVDLDPEELETNRDMQLMALARYARVGVPDEFLGWGDQKVSTVRRLFGVLNKILEMERSPRPGET